MYEFTMNELCNTKEDRALMIIVQCNNEMKLHQPLFSIVYNNIFNILHYLNNGHLLAPLGTYIGQFIFVLKC